MNILKNFKKKNILILCGLAILTSVLIYLRVQSYYIQKFDEFYLNTPCHFVKTEDALPLLDDDFQIPHKSIFFIETTCKGGLDSRQACSVESAARTHPQWQINVLFCSPISHHALNHTCLKTLLQYKNIKFARIHMSEYIKGTLLDSLITKEFLIDAAFPIEKTANAMRYLTLFKWPGIYLDTDVLVAKNLESLGPNWAAREDKYNVNSAALALSGDHIGRKMAYYLLDGYRQWHRFNKWGSTGPKLITQILKDFWCTSRKVEKFSAATCSGFEVYSSREIYPIHYRKIQRLFKSGDKIHKRFRGSTLHLWNRLTRNNTIIPRDSPFGILAKKLCPSIYMDCMKKDLGQKNT